jgi:hypothetical protein
MSLLYDEVARLIALAGPEHRDGTTKDRDGEVEQPITSQAAAMAWAIVTAVPFVGGMRTDSDETSWVRIRYPGDIELDIEIEGNGEVDFDFDRGQGRTRCMLSLVAMPSGGLIYSIFTPSHKMHGGVPSDMVAAKLAELFQQFRDG